MTRVHVVVARNLKNVVWGKGFMINVRKNK